MGGLVLRRATLADLDAVAAIHEAALCRLTAASHAIGAVVRPVNPATARRN